MTASISHILASSATVWVDEKNEGGRSLPNLQKGQLITAKVDGVFSGRRARLLIGDQPVTARTYIPLQVGETILLKVTATGSQPTFTYLPVTGDHRLHLPLQTLIGAGPYGVLFRALEALLLAGLPRTDPSLAKAAEHVQRLLQSFSIASRSPSELQGLVYRSGLMWEQKLGRIAETREPIPGQRVLSLVRGDLKALALHLASLGSEKESVWLDDIRAFLDGIERLQLLNGQISKETGRYLFPLPLPEDAHFRFGQLYVDLGGGSDPEARKPERTVRVSLLLEMSNLGYVQADLSILKDALTGSLGLQSDALRAWVEPHIPELIARLRENGFQVHDISCVTLTPAECDSATLAQRLVDGDGAGLHIVI